MPSIDTLAARVTGARLRDKFVAIGCAGLGGPLDFQGQFGFLWRPVSAAAEYATICRLDPQLEEQNDGGGTAFT